MVVRLRLARFGCKNRPFYRVMAADSRSPRDGKHLEVLGYYNPLPGQDGGKRMGLKFDRVKYEVLQYLDWMRDREKGVNTSIFNASATLNGGKAVVMLIVMVDLFLVPFLCYDLLCATK
ncbi:hypothetical protein C3L33_03554, partial [Rhododendron williamsianum]